MRLLTLEAHQKTGGRSVTAVALCSAGGTRMTDILGYLAVILSGMAGVAFAIAGMNWGRLLSYRITEGHLVIRYAGLPFRKIALSDITGVERFELGPGLLRCVGLHLGGASPWATGGFLSTESWLSHLCGPVLLLKRRAGRQVAITPTAPESFIADLYAAMR